MQDVETENETPTNEDELESINEVEEEAEETPKTYSAEEHEQLKAELEKEKARAENMKVRAEKAEKVKKEVPPELVVPDGLTPKDYLTLTERGVGADDFDEVMRIAKILDKPIFEALDDKTMRAILNERVEERKTANATQTKSGRGGTKTSGDDLLRRAEETGEVPDNYAEMVKMEEARIARAKAARDK